MEKKELVHLYRDPIKSTIKHTANISAAFVQQKKTPNSTIIWPKYESAYIDPKPADTREDSKGRKVHG